MLSHWYLNGIQLVSSTGASLGQPVQAIFAFLVFIGQKKGAPLRDAFIRLDRQKSPRARRSVPRMQADLRQVHLQWKFPYPT